MVLPGGSGHLGQLLTEHFTARGDEVVVLGRGAGSVTGARHVRWDGRTVEDIWAREVDGADLVVNLAGRSVDCRYDKTNLAEMYGSRVESTRAVGRAIAGADRPPPTWLQMSTATVYAHTFGPPHDEDRHTLGGHEEGVPTYWRGSVHIAEAWEQALNGADTPDTRRVALRTSMVMAPTPGGAFRTLERLARLGLGGAVAGGRMFMSWIHARDFVRAIDHLASTHALDGPVNLAAPEPLEQRDFMAAVRRAQSTLRVPLALPATRWMTAIGSWALRTDPELVLKSRRVVSRRLAESGFEFEYPSWGPAAADLVRAVEAR